MSIFDQPGCEPVDEMVAHEFFKANIVATNAKGRWKAHQFSKWLLGVVRHCFNSPKTPSTTIRMMSHASIRSGLQRYTP